MHAANGDGKKRVERRVADILTPILKLLFVDDLRTTVSRRLPSSSALILPLRWYASARPPTQVEVWNAKFCQSDF